MAATRRAGQLASRVRHWLYNDHVRCAGADAAICNPRLGRPALAIGCSDTRRWTPTASDPLARSQVVTGLARSVSTIPASQAGPPELQLEGLNKGPTKHDDKEEAKQSEEEEVEDEKTKILRAALGHVPQLGWTEAAMAAGARDVGLSPAIIGAFPRKGAALVEFFMDECNHAMTEELASREEELAKMLLHERLATIAWMRLEMQIPYLSKWAQALSIQALPLNVPTSIKQRALLVDDIWHTAGDQSVDMDWYAKRAVLAGVYSTTELYMLTDTSPGFGDTQKFLGRQIKDALDCGKSVQEAGNLAQSIGTGLQNTINSFLRNVRTPSGPR